MSVKDTTNAKLQTPIDMECAPNGKANYIDLMDAQLKATNQYTREIHPPTQAWYLKQGGLENYFNGGLL
jgi:hypothetical protein